MASVYRATFSFHAPPRITSGTVYRHRLSCLASSVPAPFPSKRTNRKNHLRPKIHKTLTKPFTPAPLPHIVPIEHTIPIPIPIPIPLPPANDAVLDAPSGEISSGSLLAEETDRFEEFGVSETIGAAGEYSCIVGKISAKSLLKFCGYLVGVTICAVWVLGSSSSSKKEVRLNNLDSKGRIFLNGNNVAYFDGSDQEEKISEIRAMAREAREKEKRGRKEGNEESDIEKEIGERLVKLEKRLNSKKEKLPESFLNYLGLFGNDDDDDDDDEGLSENSLDPKEDLKALMFKKKLKFKSPSMNSRNSPKGFSGSSSINGSYPNGESTSSDSGTMKIDGGMKAAGVQLNSSKDGNKLEKEKEDLPKELESGTDQKTRKGRLSSEVTNSWKSRDLEKQKSLKLTKENQKTTTNLDVPSSSRRNISSNTGKRPVANKVGDKKSAVQTNLWWLKLPYALAILMRRGLEKEEPAGLYALRTPYQAGDQACTVAFEDRGDANNFCYLLESYFEDLVDFSADIVPLSIQELHEGVKSRSKKVIVVKKGQLKLYAGQPFAEVEMALLSLIDQDQGI